MLGNLTLGVISKEGRVDRKDLKATYFPSASEQDFLIARGVLVSIFSSFLCPKFHIKSVLSNYTNGLLFFLNSVLAEQQRCHQLGSVRQGVTLTVKDSKAKHLLGPAKSLKDCISLSCKTSDANYAVLEDGKCHALHCKKNTCQISEDVKSKQKIVGLSRSSNAKAKHVKKVSSKKNQSKGMRSA